MNPCSNQTNLEESLLEVFRSDKRRRWSWLRKELKRRGVESRFATIIAKREGASEDLLKLNPREINHFIYSLIEEFKEAGFSEKIALTNPGRLREFKRLELPITARTIIRNPQVLLENKKELESSGLPVNKYTILRNPKSVAKEAKRSKRTSLSKPL